MVSGLSIVSYLHGSARPPGRIQNVRRDDGLHGTIREVDDDGDERGVLFGPELQRMLAGVTQRQDSVRRMLRLQGGIDPFVVGALVAENKIDFMRSRETER